MDQATGSTYTLEEEWETRLTHLLAYLSRELYASIWQSHPVIRRWINSLTLLRLLNYQITRIIFPSGSYCKHNLYYSFSEVIGGYISGSLAIMSDAAHMFSDLASFLISLLAIHLSEKPAKKVPLMLWFFHNELWALGTSLRLSISGMGDMVMVTQVGSWPRGPGLVDCNLPSFLQEI